MKIFLLLLASISLFAGDYFLGVQSHTNDTKKILYGNHGTNYFLDEYTKSNLALTWGIMDDNTSYGIKLSKEILNDDHKYAIGIFYRPVMSHLNLLEKLNTSLILDTGIDYSYKEVSTMKYGASGTNFLLGFGLRTNYDRHSFYATTGFEFDFTFTHADEFALSRKYMYYGLYLTLGYQYRF